MEETKREIELDPFTLDWVAGTLFASAHQLSLRRQLMLRGTDRNCTDAVISNLMSIGDYLLEISKQSSGTPGPVDEPPSEVYDFEKEGT